MKTVLYCGYHTRAMLKNGVLTVEKYGMCGRVLQWHEVVPTDIEWREHMIFLIKTHGRAPWDEDK